MITIKINKCKKVNTFNYSLFVSFPYDNEVLNVVRSFPNRFWHKNAKEWELPADMIGKFIEQLPNQEFDISGSYFEITKPDAEKPAGFEFKTKPFQHQVEGFNFGLANDRWFLGDEQGLGKTKQVIDIAIAKKIQRGYKHCLIVCGVNSLKWNWVNEVATHSNEKAWILGQRSHGGKWEVEGNAAKLVDLRRVEDVKVIKGSYFLITNVESLRDKEIAGEIKKLVDSKVIGVVAIDEIHKCKNPTSQQGKGILQIDSEVRIAMTGTPVMNNPLDLYVILKWLGHESHTFYAFKNHYCEMGGFGGYQIMGYKNMGELRERLGGIMLRRLKKDVLDLPEKTYVDEYVEMGGKQLKIYNEVTAIVRENIDQIKASSNPLAELIRMRQATGYTGILSSTVKESAKLDRMEELVEEAVENGKKVVIFSNWTQVTDVVKTRLAKKYKGVVITGQTSDAERQVNVNHFQNNPDCKYVVGTIGAMGTGLTLTAGTVEIFLDEPWTMAAKKQAEDRCHRVGTTENVTIYNLMCKGTIDEKIHELIFKKEAISNALVDNVVTMGTNEILDFLVG